MDKKFNFFESYHRALSRVPDSSYGRIVRSMSEFVFEGVIPTFENDVDSVAWELIRPILERGQELSKIRAEAGSKGKGVSRNVGNNHASKQNKSKTKQIKTDKEKEKDKDKDKGIGDYIENIKKRNNLPGYVADDFADVLTEWIEYKKERGQSYKPRGLKICYNRLRELSGNDPAKARLIVENSIANNYQGLFKLKEDNNYESNRTTSAENILAAQQQHIRSVSASISQAADRKGEVHELVFNR